MATLENNVESSSVNELEHDLNWLDNVQFDATMDAVNWLKNLNETGDNNESEPQKIQVRNKPCTMCSIPWIYEGSWLLWGKNNCDNPWWWRWYFVSSDRKYSFDWMWNDYGIPTKGKLTVDWKVFEITKTYVLAKDKTKLSSLHWTGSVNGLKYNCVLDEKFQISQITYAWVTINLVHEGWKTYLVNKNWKKLEYTKSHYTRQNGIIEHKDVDLPIIKIAELISTVKNSGKTLDEFELGNDFFADIQADYKNQFLDEDLVDDWDYWVYWIYAYRLVAWLNASRKDFWI